MTDYPKLEKSPNPVVRAQDIAFVKFARRDLAAAEGFLSDFGLTLVDKSETHLSMRAKGGYGPCYRAEKSSADGFLGLGLAVAAKEDLETLAALPNSGDIEAMDGYDKGMAVALKDPSGMPVWAVFGAATKPTPSRQPLAQNTLADNRRLNDVLRPKAQPSEVLRLGHAVLSRIEFYDNAAWYINMFGLIPTDVQTMQNGQPLVAFMRCDCGDTPTDHHTLVVAQHVANAYNHSAYETLDIDDIAMGQEYLLAKGHRHAWGIGRHTLGSQIFDYWRDPCGERFEHYCDSDKFTADYPTQYSTITGLGSAYQWGPPPPKDFEAKPGVRFIFKAIMAVMQSPTLSFGALKRMAKIGAAKPRPWL